MIALSPKLRGGAPAWQEYRQYSTHVLRPGNTLVIFVLKTVHPGNKR